MIEAIRCPSCGAPLDPQTAPRAGAFECPFCKTWVRLDAPARPAVLPVVPPLLAAPTPTEKGEGPVIASQELLTEVKALLREGQRDRAIARYAEVMKTTEKAAIRAVNQRLTGLFWASWSPPFANSGRAFRAVALTILWSLPPVGLVYLFSATQSSALKFFAALFLLLFLPIEYWNWAGLLTCLRSCFHARYGAIADITLKRCALIQPEIRPDWHIVLIEAQVCPRGTTPEQTREQVLVLSSGQVQALQGLVGKSMRARLGPGGRCFPLASC